MKKLTALTLLLAVLIAMSAFAGCSKQKTSGEETALIGEYWTERSEAAASINEYLASVTDEAPSDFIPEEGRIAVSDLDGTLMCETYPFCFEYMVLADDAEREYGDADKADEKKKSYEEMGIGVISMRNDFKTIYGDEVKKAD